MKKTSRRMTGQEPTGRVLRLSRESIRVLSLAEMAAAAGGSACITTSWSTESVVSGTCTTTTCQ